MRLADSGMGLCIPMREGVCFFFLYLAHPAPKCAPDIVPLQLQASVWTAHEDSLAGCLPTSGGLADPTIPSTRQLHMPWSTCRAQRAVEPQEPPAPWTASPHPLALAPPSGMHDRRLPHNAANALFDAADSRHQVFQCEKKYY
mmetsp:Transcript_28492/g.48421  ORF Transcript_28492/g.48421 Transcript_28492/m.48421 type:complete len:143 (+) Transcript_28492:1109-1537(+)